MGNSLSPTTIKSLDADYIISQIKAKRQKFTDIKALPETDLVPITDSVEDKELVLNNCIGDLKTRNKKRSVPNFNLLVRQKLTLIDAKWISELHDLRSLGHKMMKYVKFSDTETRLKSTKYLKKIDFLRSINDALTEVEFELQRVWKFPEDARYHMFWEIPHCGCPDLDNRDSYPYQAIYCGGCKLHGWEDGELPNRKTESELT